MASGGNLHLVPQDEDAQRQRFLAKRAEKGTEKEAIEAAGIDRATLKTWQEDPQFEQDLVDARQDFRDRMVGKLYVAVDTASSTEILLHPNAVMFAIKQLDSSFKDNAPTVNIDARSVNVPLLEPDQLDRIKKALRAALDEDRPIEIGGAENG